MCPVMVPKVGNSTPQFGAKTSTKSSSGASSQILVVGLLLLSLAVAAQQPTVKIMMTPYEETRQMNIEENNKKLEALNLPSLSQSLRKSSSATSKPSLVPE
ncbi:hypothetical protein P8452_73405 [Trifolium repens]|nr:hypothetical protein P8452_73405 [Trifolium repens]